MGYSSRRRLLLLDMNRKLSIQFTKDYKNGIIEDFKTSHGLLSRFLLPHSHGMVSLRKQHKNISPYCINSLGQFWWCNAIYLGYIGGPLMHINIFKMPQTCRGIVPQFMIMQHPLSPSPYRKLKKKLLIDSWNSNEVSVLKGHPHSPGRIPIKNAVNQSRKIA